MARARTVHRCRECGGTSPRWVGRCPVCDGWNTLDEERVVTAPATFGPGGGLGPSAGALPVLLADLDAGQAAARPTGLPELDRVLGGGLVPGSVTVLGGEPGIGKSTLLLQMMASLAAGGARCLLVSAEESAPQVRQRAERLGALGPNIWLVAETVLSGIRAAVDQVRPDVVVVDSIQTVYDPDVESVPGSVSQVRGCAQGLVGLAKAPAGPAVVLVGHVTKDGALAGPRLLEHLVDTVLSFDGDRHHALRLLRALKHRFGPAGELGLFEMSAAGLRGVADPGGLFLGDRREGSPGSVVFPALEGDRPLLVEVQALVVSSELPAPRRSVSGLDAARLALLLAVLDKRADLAAAHCDVYVSVVGGVRVVDPGADLALCLALASALTDRPLPDDLVILGEVGLAGEVRQVAHTPRRLAEAARLGFRQAVVPASAPDHGPLRLRRVSSLRQAVHGLLLGEPESTSGGEQGVG